MYGIIPFWKGIDEVIKYKHNKKYVRNKVNILKYVIKEILWHFVLLVLIVFVFFILAQLRRVVYGEYIAVIIYTLLLAMTSSKFLYQSPSVRVDSSWKAFKKGFTQSHVNSFLVQLPLKAVINIIYLAILIIAHIEDLGYFSFNPEFSHFCTLNKYGILIMLSVEKIIGSTKAEKERTEILTEANLENLKIEEAKFNDFKEELKEIITILKETYKIKRELKRLERKNKELQKVNKKMKSNK